MAVGGVPDVEPIWLLDMPPEQPVRKIRDRRKLGRIYRITTAPLTNSVHSLRRAELQKR
jgi:hypothetical protein